MFGTVARVALNLLIIVVLACGSSASVETSTPIGPARADEPRFIALGDIDPDEPTKKIMRFQPLADYLAGRLGEFGFGEGRVVIARDIDEMSQFLRDGSVDIYFDSPFLTLAVQKLSGSKIILRQWEKGVASYSSTYVALRNGEVNGVEDFVGKVIAFEGPRSTSGFVLPAGTLIQRGYSLREVVGPNADVGTDEIGYFFSRDEENTFQLILDGKVAGGGVSAEDYEELPTELTSEIKSFDRTITVPRQLVSVRPGLDAELVARVGELLISLDQTEEGRQILEGLKQTKKFNLVPIDAKAALRILENMIKLVSKD